MIDVSDGFLSLMDDNGETREDLKVPDGDLGKEIEKKFSDGEQFMVSFNESQREYNGCECWTAWLHPTKNSFLLMRTLIFDTTKKWAIMCLPVSLCLCVAKYLGKY